MFHQHFNSMVADVHVLTAKAPTPSFSSDPSSCTFVDLQPLTADDDSQYWQASMCKQHHTDTSVKRLRRCPCTVPCGVSAVMLGANSIQSSLHNAAATDCVSVDRS